MKVLHINSYFSVSKFYKSLYDKQRESGLDLEVYVPVAAGYDAQGRVFGDYATLSRTHGKYDRIIFHIKHNKTYKDIIGKYEIGKFSVAHAHSLFSNGYIALKLKKNFGIPYVVAVRNTDVNVFFKQMRHMRRLGVEILEEAEKVIFLSKSYRDSVMEKYVPKRIRKEIMDKSEIMPNGIDDFWFENRGTPKEISEPKKLRLVYAGVIDRNKNLDATVKAINILQSKGYDVQFTVVGRIEDKKIHGRISSLPYVKYIEPQPKEELIKIYRSSDIFVMPSVTETFGLVYAEAMSQGLPVIYTKGQGFDGQFEEGEGGIPC